MREVALLLLMRIQYCRPNLPIPFPLPKPFSFNVSISAVTKESVALKIAFGGHTIQLHLGQRHEQDRAMCPAPFQYISKSGFSFSLRHNNVHKLYYSQNCSPRKCRGQLASLDETPKSENGAPRRVKEAAGDVGGKTLATVTSYQIPGSDYENVWLRNHDEQLQRSMASLRAATMAEDLTPISSSDITKHDRQSC